LTSRALASAALAAIVSIAAGAPAHAQGPAPAQPAPAPTPPPAPAADVQLSNETTFTRWANAVTRGTARARPSSKARRVGRLRFLTEDGFPEVYILLASRQDAAGVTWVRIRLPQRPNNVTGWVRSGTLGPTHLIHTQLVVSRRTLRVTLYKRGKRRFRARVGIGAPRTPTPAGSFWIREKFHVRGNPMYGTRAMGTSAYSNVLTDWPGGGVIGLHGTSEPGLVPGRPSHGCVRLKNPDIERLYALTPIGTPVRIKR
jgi:lipoprotein-anchoring transpeptidase ErfK/SrfK